MTQHDVHVAGLLPHADDARDFQMGALFGLFPYTPKHTRWIIPTISIKNQFLMNTCTWNAVTIQKEIDEKVPLSVESLVIQGQLQGRISGNGFSTLRDSQMVVVNSGIAEEHFLPERDIDWVEYVNPGLLTDAIKQNAATHKSSSFWLSQGRDHILQALDQGRALQTGLDWYQEYNMSGGFRAPWDIKTLGQNKVGGHAFTVIGYDMAFASGGQVLIAQQSCSSEWGDQGKFYIDLNFALQHCYAFYGQFDIPVDSASFLNSHQFALVKDPNSPACYQIFGQQKCPYPDEATMILFNGPDWKKQLVAIDPNVFAAIETGPIVQPKDSPEWSTIVSLAVPARWQEIMKHLSTNL